MFCYNYPRLGYSNQSEIEGVSSRYWVGWIGAQMAITHSMAPIAVAILFTLFINVGMPH